MREFIAFMFDGFWHFVGCLIILSAFMQFIFLMWNRLLRHININKHGYPPAHCDADGDFKKEIKEEQK